MPISDDVMEKARGGDAVACRTLLANSYPSAVRIARALIGDAGAADRVVQSVLRRGARMLPGWGRGTMPENWFYHHTLLAARETSGAMAPPAPEADPLAAAGDARRADPGYLAFVRAVRHLPHQQREAFILHHGETLNSRLLGITMDCSSGAAETHLNAATEELSSIAGASLRSYTAALGRAYLSLGPDASTVARAVRPYANSYVRPVRIRRGLKRLAVLVVLITAALAAWHWRAAIVDSLIPWIRGKLG